MGKVTILLVIFLLFLSRYLFLRSKGKSCNFLFVSFFLFCVPFDLTKGLSEQLPGMVAGTVGPIFFFNTAMLTAAMIAMLTKWNIVSISIKSSRWIIAVFVLIIVSYLNPSNVSVKGTSIFALFFVSHVLMFAMLYSFITQKQLLDGIFDAFKLLCICQVVLAICFPLLSISFVTTLFHSAAELTSTRHGTMRVGAVGTFAHPGNLALFMVIASAFFLSTYLNQYRRKVSMVILLINIVTLVLTYSRTSYVSFVAVLIFLLYVSFNAKKNIFSVFGILKLIIPLFCALIWLIYFSPLSELFLESDSSTQYNNREMHLFMTL